MAALPAEIYTGGTAGGAISEIHLLFSEEVNPIDANAPANYELRQAVNGVFDDSDDVVYALDPEFTPGSNEVTLHILGGLLPSGDYRLIARGTTSIHDLAGLKLDGDVNGAPGRGFRPLVPSPLLARTGRRRRG